MASNQCDSRGIRWKSWPMVIHCIQNSGLPLLISDSRIRRMTISKYSFRPFEVDRRVLPLSPYLTLAQRQGLLPITTLILPSTPRLTLLRPCRLLFDTPNHQAQLLGHLHQAPRNSGLLTTLALVKAPALDRTLCIQQRSLMQCQNSHLCFLSFPAHGLHRLVRYYPPHRPQ